MKTRVAALSIIVEDPESVETLNEVLHEARAYVIGRMGIPYPKHDISIISLVLDAPQDMISHIAGKVGTLKGVSVKVAYSTYEFEGDVAGE